MGKLRDKPSKLVKQRNTKSSPRKGDDFLVIHRNPNPSPEQIARSKAMGRFLEDKLREMAAMTPAEIKQADRDWQKFKKSINEGRYRKVILD